MSAYPSSASRTEQAIVPYLERLELAAAVDKLVPWQGGVPLGTLVEILQE